MHYPKGNNIIYIPDTDTIVNMMDLSGASTDDC